MQFLSSKFARGINRIFGRKGSVFRERFFSRVLSTVSELVQALRYVGLNPVKAGLCLRPEEWAGSAVPAYGSTPQPEAPWAWRGWMYRVLGFHQNARAALSKILTGATCPRRPGRGRQNRLPFRRGLPRLAQTPCA